MKSFFTALVLLFTISITAQSKYEQGMAKAFTLWQENKLDDAANLFERIATAENEQWLPDYYVAQLYVLKCWNSWENRDEAALKANLDKAQEFVNNIKSKSKDEPYAKQMQAQIYTVWVVHDGMKYGMKYSGKVAQLYNDALEAQPENPIFIFNKAEWEIGAASFFGTSIDEQCAAIQKAIELFPTFKPESPFHPSEGLERAIKALEKCK